MTHRSRKAPTSFTAGRKVTLNGTTYQPGATVPNSVVKGLKRLSALVSRRILVPNVKQSGAKGRVVTPTPEAYGTAERKAL